MANLKAKIGSITLDNPLILASGTPGWDSNHLNRGAEVGCGAVVTKTIGVSDEPVMHPHCGRFRLLRQGRQPFGMINAELSSTITKHEWLQEELPKVNKGSTKLFVSLSAQPQPEGTATLVAEAVKAGSTDLVELNVSTPTAGGKTGARIGQNPDAVFQAVTAARQVCPWPLTVKFTPSISDITEVVQSAANAGADGIVIANSVMGFAGVDIYTGKPHLPVFGGYTGPAVKPIISKLVAETARLVDLPVIAVGGVSHWEDVVEYLMMGAAAVQICTSIMWKGYEIIPKIAKGLNEYMDSQGYNSLDDLKGIALRHMMSISDYAQGPRLYVDVNRELCNDCGICTKVCFFDALSLENQHLKVNRPNCDGCELCVEWCPRQALKLTP